MATIPDWIEDRLDPELDKKLTQRHVVETMIDANRPFFSIEQIRARVRPDVTKETVRNRLHELQEIDIVDAETYPESITLYFINHPASRWPLSPEGQDAIETESPLETLSASDFIRLRNPAGIRTLVLAGFQLSLVMVAVGAVLGALSVEPGISSDVPLWSAATTLFLLSLTILIAERIARGLRDRGLPSIGNQQSITR